MSSFYLSGPIAPESNPPIEPQDFQPGLFFITAITRGRTTTVTVSAPSWQNYTINQSMYIGQLVRFDLTKPYGIRQINKQTGYVLSFPSSTQVVVDIDSSLYDPFISSPPTGKTDPQIVPIGDINQGAINSSGRTNQQTFIPGSFINVSPN